MNQELVDEHAPPSFPLALFLSARSRLRLAQGRPAPALEDARAAGALVSRSIFNPGCSGWRGDAALALAGLERRDEARAVAEDELGWARRFDVPDAIGAALRTLGVVLLGRERLEALRESVAVLERAEGRLGYARSLLELGAALRHAGERGQPRDVLRAALDLTARAGASGLADRAHAELVAAGARPRRERRLLSGRESLTTSEVDVGELDAAFAELEREVTALLEADGVDRPDVTLDRSAQMR